MEPNMIETPQYAQLPKPEVVPTPKETFTLFEEVIAIIVMFLGYGYIKFVIAPVLVGVSAACYFAFFLILAFVFMQKKSVKLSANNCITLGILLMFSFSLAYFDTTPFLKFLCVLFIIGGTIYWIYSSCYGIKSIRRGVFSDFLTAAFAVPFSHFSAFSGAIGSVMGKNRATKNGKYVLIGLIITIPVTLIVAVLLISSDLMFEKLADSVLSDGAQKALIFLLQFAIGIPLAFYLYGLLHGSAKAKEKYSPDSEKQKAHSDKAHFINPIVLCTAATPVCILYVLYFVVQSGYFLSAFNNLLPEGFSYAEYARRGFFELFAVALINLGIIAFLLGLCKKTEDNIPKAIKAYAIIISSFTLLLIATALSKMIMYIGEYGLTQLRVYTSWFMILLALIMLGIIMSCIFKKLNLAKIVVYTFTVMFMILTFSNVDAKIAQYNVTMFLNGSLKEIDIHMLYDLSPSAAEYALPLIEDENANYYNTSLRYLGTIYSETKPDDVRCMTYSEYRIHEMLGEYEDVRNYEKLA